MKRRGPRLPPVIAQGVARGWRALSGTGEAELVPQARLSGPMPWVIAIMVALTVIAAAAGLSLRNAATTAEADLSGGITIQIVEAEPEARQRQAEAALARLRDTRGIVSARQVPQHDVERLIEPWLGESGGGDEAIPVPALIDARMQQALSAERLAEIRRDLRGVAPTARVDAQANWLKPVFAAISSLQWLALALIVLLALATAAAVLLAARTALGSNRDTIEIVHLLGGTDSQIARIFQRSIGFDAAGGGAVGLALGLVVILALGKRFAALDTGMINGGALDWIDWLLLALIPVAGVLLAIMTARLSVMRALRQMV
jgi:cell division transport system permease protein